MLTDGRVRCDEVGPISDEAARVALAKPAGSVFLLAGREGEEFGATVLQVDAPKNRAVVLLYPHLRCWSIAQQRVSPRE